MTDSPSWRDWGPEQLGDALAGLVGRDRFGAKVVRGPDGLHYLAPEEQQRILEKMARASGSPAPRPRRLAPPGQAALAPYIEQLRQQTRNIPPESQAENLRMFVASEMADVSTILFLSANPTGTVPLRLDREQNVVQGELDRAPLRTSFRLLSYPAVKYSDLQYRLTSTTPSVLHFSGHGDVLGISVEGPDGRSHLVPGEALAELVGQPIIRSVLRLVVLNACLSAPQAQAIAEAIDGVVVGMSSDIDDGSAIEFARGLYGALGQGLDLGQSFKLARNQIAIAGLPSRAIPQAFARQGLNPSIMRLEQ